MVSRSGRAAKAGAPRRRRARRRRSRSEPLSACGFRHLLVIVDLLEGDVHHHGWLRKWRRGRQADVPRRHEEDSGLGRSVDRKTRLRTGNANVNKALSKAKQACLTAAAKIHDRLAQAGCRGAVQQDRGAIAPARTARPLAKPAPGQVQGWGPATDRRPVDLGNRGLPERALRPPRLSDASPIPRSIVSISERALCDVACKLLSFPCSLWRPGPGS